MTQPQSVQPRTRNLSPLWLERRLRDRDGETVTDIGLARGICEHCGGRAPDRKGHPRGEDGQPTCVAAKARMRGIGW